MSTILLQDSSKLEVQEKDQGKRVIVKGLFTTDLIDRQGHYVDPSAFKLDRYKNTGTLLVNHDFIKDSSGNKRAAGKITELTPVYVSSENKDNPSELILKSIEDDSFVSFWPKFKSPDLVAGDKGIFAKGEVFDEETAKRVLAGDFGAFSWTGRGISSKRENGLQEVVAVDLFEISLVNIPINPNSTFVYEELEKSFDPEGNSSSEIVSCKTINLKDCELCHVSFHKEDHTLDYIKDYAKSLSTDTYKILEDEDHFYISFLQEDLVMLKKCFEYTLGETTFLMSPKQEDKKIVLKNIVATQIKESKMSEDTKNTLGNDGVISKEKLYLLNIDDFLAKNPSAVVTPQKSLKMGDTEVEINFIEMPVDLDSDVLDIKDTSQTEDIGVENVNSESADDETSSITAEGATSEEDTSQDNGELKELPTENQKPEVNVDDRLLEITSNMTVLAEAVTTLSSLFSETKAQTEAIKKENELFLSKAAEDLKSEISLGIKEHVEKSKKTEDIVQDNQRKLQKSMEKISKYFENTLPEETDRDEILTKGLETSQDPKSDVTKLLAHKIFRGSN